MILDITHEQKNFLVRSVLQDRKDLIDKVMSGCYLNRKKWQLNVSYDTAIDIGDMCSEMLQLVGFDEHYALTDEGRVLDELIYLFNTAT